MLAYVPLAPDVARCNGFTYPQDRDQCRRFTERQLATVQTPWTKGDSKALAESLWPPGCSEFLPIPPLER